jgi:solute carrier family 25 (mitochondrial folate transporter), member 32
LRLPNSGGFHAIYRDDGLKGLYRGTSLALVGVGNGALQFVAYEKMKNWAFERKRRRFTKLGREWTTDDDKLVRSVPFNVSFLIVTHSSFFFVCVVEHDVHFHVWRVQARSAIRNISIPSHPLSYPGDDLIHMHSMLSFIYSKLNQ